MAACTHTHTHARTHARTHAHTHTHTRARKHARTHIRSKHVFLCHSSRPRIRLGHKQHQHKVAPTYVAQHMPGSRGVSQPRPGSRGVSQSKPDSQGNITIQARFARGVKTQACLEVSCLFFKDLIIGYLATSFCVIPATASICFPRSSQKSPSDSLQKPRFAPRVAIPSLDIGI